MKRNSETTEKLRYLHLSGGATESHIQPAEKQQRNALRNKGCLKLGIAARPNQEENGCHSTVGSLNGIRWYPAYTFTAGSISQEEET